MRRYTQSNRYELNSLLRCFLQGKEIIFLSRHLLRSGGYLHLTFLFHNLNCLEGIQINCVTQTTLTTLN